MFGWRDFANQRSLFERVGLAPTPYASGNSEVEHCISKAGYRWVQATLVEQAWKWLRLQPENAWTNWFNRRFSGGGNRIRRVGIVAPARRLVVALQRHLKQGGLPLIYTAHIRHDPAMASLLDRSLLAAGRVLVVGDAMLDRYWFGNVDRISPEAPVPIVHVQREEDRLGGAANVALNVKALGAQVTLLTVVGDDEPAHSLERLLAEQGVVSLLERNAALRTIVKLRVVGRSQQLMRVDFENQPSHEVLVKMLAQYQTVLPHHDVVLFSDYGKGGLGQVQAMIQAARAAGKAVLVDPKGCDYGRYAGATVVTPNLAELAQVAGVWTSELELHRKAQALRAELDLTGLLVTRSGEGMTLFDDQGYLHQPALAQQVFDVTGAGDTVIATVAAMLAAGASLREALPVANRAAGIVVSRFGTATASFDETFAP